MIVSSYVAVRSSFFSLVVLLLPSKVVAVLVPFPVFDFKFVLLVLVYPFLCEDVLGVACGG